MAERRVVVSEALECVAAEATDAVKAEFTWDELRDLLDALEPEIRFAERRRGG